MLPFTARLVIRDTKGLATVTPGFGAYLYFPAFAPFFREKYS